MKKTLTGAITLVVLIAMLAATASAAGFSDTQGHWAASYIDSAVSLGYFSGNPDGTFAPDAVTSRAMMVTVLARAAGAELDNTKSSFSDVPENEWYTGAITWAAENGIAKGVGDGKFMPNEPVSREQMCAFIVRFLKAVGYDLSGFTSDISGFADKDSISDYAKDDVGLCVSLGLINGIESESGLCFAPTASASRAQVAVVLVQYNTVSADIPTVSEVAPPSGSESGSGSGSGGGTVTPGEEHTEEEIAEEKQVISYLNNMVETLPTVDVYISASSEAKSCINIFVTCVNAVIDDHNNGQFITKEYVKSTYGEDIERFNEARDALNKDDTDSLYNILLSFDISARSAVMDYFGVTV